MATWGLWKPLLSSMPLWCWCSSFIWPKLMSLTTSKAQICGLRVSVSDCRARAHGCRAMPRLSLPQFKSEGQKEIGNFCREGGCLLCSFASQSPQCSSGYSQLFHSSALGWDLGTRSKGEAAFGCTELFSVWAVKSKHLFKREHSEQ